MKYYFLLSSRSQLNWIFFENRKFDFQTFSECRKFLSDGILQMPFRLIIFCRKPFVFQLAQDRFGNIQMRWIRRQIKDKQTATLPTINALAHLSARVNSGIIQNNHRQFWERKRKPLQLLDHKSSVNRFFAGRRPRCIWARKQSKTDNREGNCEIAPQGYFF